MIRHSAVALVPLLSLLTSAAFSQNRVDSVNHVDPSLAYCHIYAIVPMVAGSGTLQDPKRPMFALSPAQLSTTSVGVPGTGGTGSGAGTSPTSTSRTGVLGHQMVVSDDGTMAFVEFVGATRNDLINIITSTTPGVQVFERWNGTTQAAMEAAFGQFKKGFSLANWQPLRVQ